MRESLYLAQTYQDAWEDFQRSLHSPSFPVWDHVILTASNEHQARAFRAQLERRKGKLPARTRFAVIPDEGNVRVGGGGFLQGILRRGVSRDMLQHRLKEVFSDTDINVWDARLV